jgi:phospholipase/carboxylesterase
MDGIVPAANAALLARQLQHAGANVEHRTLPSGHGLSQADVTLTRDFLAKLRE